MPSRVERAERAALYIFLAGVGVAMVAAAGPLAFPDLPKIIWQVVTCLGVALTVSSAGFLFYEYRDLIRTKRMIPLLGMLISGICFVGFTAWYFWPTKELEKTAEVHAPSPPQPSPTTPTPTAPLARLRLMGVEFFPPEGDRPPRARYTIGNVGSQAATNILKAPAHGVVLGTLSREQEDELFEKLNPQIPPIGSEGSNEFQPGEGAKYLADLTVVSRDSFDQIKAGKLRLYFILRIAFRDSATPTGKRWIVESCHSYSGDMSEALLCAGHNRMYLSDASAPEVPKNTRGLSASELKRRTIDFSAQVRTFSVRWSQAETAQLLDQQRRFPIHGTEDEKQRAWTQQMKESEKSRADRQIEFINRYRPEARTLKEELLFKLKMAGIGAPPEPDRAVVVALENGNLIGPRPELLIADYLETLARMLPD